MKGWFPAARASVARCVVRSSAVLALAVALVVLSGGVARADGDPASDYLLANQVFLSSQSTGVTPAQRQLVATVAAANRAGFAIRVAVISNDYDLGSAGVLYLHPQPDAKFLLQHGYAARDGSLRGMQFIGGETEASQPCHPDESLQELQVHRVACPFSSRLKRKSKKYL